MTEIGHANADGSGRFRLDAPRTSSSRNDAFVAIALAPGFGVGWVKIDPDADQPAADITLQPEQVIQGRLFDVQGRPAQGVTVSVSSIQREAGPRLQKSDLCWSLRRPVYDWTRVNDVPAWPKPATTDADGRFTIHGVGRRLRAGLSIIDPRFALDNIDVETDDAPGAKIVTAALEPAKIFTRPRHRCRDRQARAARPVGLHRQRRLAPTKVLPAHAVPGRCRWTISRESLARRKLSASTPIPPMERSTSRPGRQSIGPRARSSSLLTCRCERGATIRGTVVEEGTGQPSRARRWALRRSPRRTSIARVRSAQP